MRNLLRVMTEANFLMTMIIVAFIASLAFGQRAHAQQARTDESQGAIIVTASRADTRLEDMPLYTTVVTQEEIRRSPAQSLDQLLRNVPSLGIGGTPAALTDPTGQNIRFRGMDKKVLVLLDGMPIHDPFYTTIQWYKLPLSSVERVEVIRGGGSSLWGNLAVGGVINIVSRRPTGSDGEASASAGRFDTYTGAVSKNFIVSDALSLNLSADGFQTGGYNTILPDYLGRYWPGRGESSAHSENVRATVYFKPSSDLNGFVRVGYHRQNEQIGGYLYGSNLQKSPDISASVTRYFDDKSSLLANFWAQWQTFDKYNGAGCYAAAVFACGASVTTAGGATAAQQAARIAQYATSHDWNTYREKGGSVMYSMQPGALVTGMQLGIDYRLISGDDDQQSYRVPTAALPQAFRIQRSNYGAGRQEFRGVFGQFKLSPIERLELNLSARWDTYTSSRGVARQVNYSNVAAPVVTSMAGGDLPDVRKSAFDPTVSARYDVSERLALRGSTYKAFRAPGMNNMYRTFGSANITVANPALGPETLVGKEVGLDWRGNSYSLAATLYTMTVKDVVANYTLNPGGAFFNGFIPQAVQNICGNSVGTGAPLCTGTVSLNTNGQDQRSNGIELEGKWDFGREWTLAANFTRNLTYYIATSTGDPTDKQLPLVPKNVAFASVQWRPGGSWAHALDVRHTGKMTLNLTDAVTDPVQQGGVTTLNASTSYKVNTSLEWFASVVNLTDKRYSESSASSVQQTVLAMPRTLTTGLRAKF